MKRYFAISLLMLLSFAVFSQTTQIENLRKQQKDLQEDIKQTNKLFLDVKKVTTTLLDRIALINKQIASRKEIMALQRREVDELEKEQARLESEIKRLNEELERKKDDYANAVRVMQANRSGQNELIFILSGKSFGESLRRMQYLKNYSQWRRGQANEIKAQNEKIKVKIADLDQAKVDRLKAINAIKEEQEKLQQEESTRQSEMKEARGKQQDLQKKLQAKQQQAKKLDGQISKLIAEEVARQEREAEARRKAEAAERARREAAKKKTDKDVAVKDKDAVSDVKQAEPKVEVSRSSVDESFNLSKDFVANRGKLPMPVTGTSSIVSQFGVNKHTEWNISTNSNGIDIKAQKDASIRAVFDGEVSKIFPFAGMNTCVIVRHGEYYTFYANIFDIYVKPGDKVKTGQSLGRIYTDPDSGIATMHFQLWQKTTKLNPAPWLRR